MILFFPANRLDRLWGIHPAFCSAGTVVFPGVKRPGVMLTTHFRLVPRLKSVLDTRRSTDWFMID
jgi:hypothetical protein